MNRSLGNLIKATLFALPLALPGLALAQSTAGNGNREPVGSPTGRPVGSSVQNFGGGGVGTSNAGAGSQGVPGAPGVEDHADRSAKPVNERGASNPKTTPPAPAGALPPSPRHTHGSARSSDETTPAEHHRAPADGSSRALEQQQRPPSPTGSQADFGRSKRDLRK
jgi:hypothetical protein